MAEHWLTMKAAAKKPGIPANRISRWAGRGLIQSKSNPLDRRSRLIDLTELQEKLAELDAFRDINSDEDADK